MARASAHIIDNFLSSDEVENLKTIVDQPGFSWMLCPHSDEEGDSNPQFIHVLYENSHGSFYSSQCAYYLDAFIKRLPIFNIIHAKINLTTRLSEEDNTLGLFHTDVPLEVLHPNYGDVVKTAVYYLNSNNGGTEIEFEDGTEFVDSVANRVVIFPSSTNHRAVRHTKGDYHRIIFNINYIGKEDAPC